MGNFASWHVWPRQSSARCLELPKAAWTNAPTRVTRSILPACEALPGNKSLGPGCEKTKRLRGCFHYMVSTQGLQPCIPRLLAICAPPRDACKRQPSSEQNGRNGLEVKLQMAAISIGSILAQCDMHSLAVHPPILRQLIPLNRIGQPSGKLHLNWQRSNQAETAIDGLQNPPERQPPTAPPTAARPPGGRSSTHPPCGSNPASQPLKAAPVMILPAPPQFSRPSSCTSPT